MKRTSIGIFGIMGVVALMANASLAHTYYLTGLGADFLYEKGFPQCDSNGCIVSDNEPNLISNGPIVVAMSDSTFGRDFKPRHLALSIVRFLVEKDLYGKNDAIFCAQHEVNDLAIESHYVCSFQGTLKKID